MADEADNQPSTSSGNPGGLTFIKRNGGLVLLRAGYQYTKKRENKNGWSYWTCVKVKECSGSLQIKVTREDLERDHKEKKLDSPLKLSVTTIIECYDEEQINNADTFHPNIKNELSDTNELIKYKILCSQSREQDVDAENSISFTEFKVENSLSHDNSNKTEEYNDQKIFTNESKVCLETITINNFINKPLKKTKNKRSIKRKVIQNKSLFDTKCFEEFATVTTMSPEVAKREVELRKESSNYKYSGLKCNLCFRGFGTQNTYDNHMKTHSLASGDYECEFCYKRYHKRFMYTHHVNKCHTLKICCKRCSYSCSSTSQASKHMNQHKGVKYTCDLCHNSYSMPNTLASHKRIKHATQFVCALCGSTFAVERGLKSHISKIHRQETNDKKGPICTDCDIHFATETAWKRHLVLSTKHEVSGCQICGEIFADEKQGKSHTRCKRTRRKDSCSICATVFDNRNAYNMHMTSQHPESAVAGRIRAADALLFVCEFCGKRFRYSSVMLKHQTNHTGELPYSCSVCGKTFKDQTAVCTHRETHRAITLKRDKYACDMCDKLFSTKSSLIKHIKNHLDIRPYSCDICGKSFQHQCDVKYHKKHVHDNVPWPTRDRRKLTTLCYNAVLK